MKPAAIYYWRRVDRPGHDCCRLFALPNGWRLAGTAVFFEGRPSCLEYEVVADAGWRTRRAKVAGHVGNRPIALRIRAAGDGRWQLVGGEQADVVEHCADVDLGFTPATNQLPLRRLRLRTGRHAEAPAAYLQVPQMRLVRLPQSYRRVSPTEYDYASPSTGYAARLQVARDGAIERYPGVFERVGARRNARTG